MMADIIDSIDTLYGRFCEVFFSVGQKHKNLLFKSRLSKSLVDIARRGPYTEGVPTVKFY